MMRAVLVETGPVLAVPGDPVRAGIPCGRRMTRPRTRLTNLAVNGSRVGGVLEQLPAARPEVAVVLA
jgi:hypothetical protein